MSEERLCGFVLPRPAPFFACFFENFSSRGIPLAICAESPLVLDYLEPFEDASEAIDPEAF
jgi:hypothetical protein